MTSLQQILEEVARKELYSGGSQAQLILEEFHGRPRFEGKTHIKKGYIVERYNPEYEEEHPGKSKLMIRGITRHEINHRRYRGAIGCPQTLEKHVKLFYEPISDVLLKRGFSNEDVKYLVNTLEDTILHYDLNKNKNFALEGIANFFEEVGNSLPKNEKGKRKFTRFYEAHVKLNMYLWGNKQQKKLLKKFYAHDKKITEIMKNFLEKTESYYFLDESSWKDIARIYAEEFSQLMEPNYALPLFNHSGKGTKGRESELKEGEENKEGNVFDKEMQTKKFKKSMVKNAYASGEEAPNWINNFEAMDLLYESLAQKLEIKAKTYTEENQMPIMWYGKREFRVGKDNLKHITFGFDEKGKFVLRKKHFHEDIPIEVKVKPESFPRLRFGLLDTSGSMKDDIYGEENIGNKKIIPWGDKSKYHYALLAWYGFLEYLKANHLLRQNAIDLANFSRETIIGKGLQEAKKVALSPQFGITKIDKDKINYFFEGRDNLIFTISDGEIDNWDSIKDYFLENAKKHQYFHLQIGSETLATQDLKDAGLYVEQILGGEDLARKTIDLTDKIFRRTK